MDHCNLHGQSNKICHSLDPLSLGFKLRILLKLSITPALELNGGPTKSSKSGFPESSQVPIDQPKFLLGIHWSSILNLPTTSYPSIPTKSMTMSKLYLSSPPYSLHCFAKHLDSWQPVLVNSEEKKRGGNQRHVRGKRRVIV